MNDEAAQGAIVPGPNKSHLRCEGGKFYGAFKGLVTHFKLGIAVASFTACIPSTTVRT